MILKILRIIEFKINAKISEETILFLKYVHVSETTTGLTKVQVVFDISTQKYSLEPTIVWRVMELCKRYGLDKAAISIYDSTIIFEFCGQRINNTSSA